MRVRMGIDGKGRTLKPGASSCVTGAPFSVTGAAGASDIMSVRGLCER